MATTVYEFEFAQRRDVDHFVNERTIKVDLGDVYDALTDEERVDVEAGEWTEQDFVNKAEQIAERMYREGE